MEMGGGGEMEMGGGGEMEVGGGGEMEVVGGGEMEVGEVERWRWREVGGSGDGGGGEMEEVHVHVGGGRWRDGGGGTSRGKWTEEEGGLTAKFGPPSSRILSCQCLFSRRSLLISSFKSRIRNSPSPATVER